ncbi:MAG: hypothetical protein ACAF41_34325 (plasmid) [Leptolyngbya sp. BL-A-14]
MTGLASSAALPSVSAYQELVELTRPCMKMRVQYVESLERLQELFSIDADAYQDCSLTFEQFQGWWTRYNQGSTIVLCDNQIIASIGLWAITDEQFEAFIEGQIPEHDLLPVTLEECDQTPQRNWYASGIVLKKPLRGNVKTNPIKLLLERGVGGWIDSGHVSYPMRVVALSEFQEGENLLTRFNFMKVRSGEHMPDKCDLYALQLTSQDDAELLMKARNLW